MFLKTHQMRKMALKPKQKQTRNAKNTANAKKKHAHAYEQCVETNEKTQQLTRQT